MKFLASVFYAGEREGVRGGKGGEIGAGCGGREGSTKER